LDQILDRVGWEMAAWMGWTANRVNTGDTVGANGENVYGMMESMKWKDIYIC